MSEQAELPKGWTTATFDDCFSVMGDGGRRIPKTSYTDQGRFPIIDQGEGDIAGWTDRQDLVTQVARPMFIFGDHTRRIKRVSTDFVVGAQGVKILASNSLMTPGFAYHSLVNAPIVNRGYGRHFALLRNEMFVLPPLAEQHRIVDALEEQLSRLDAAEELVNKNLQRAEILRKRVTSTLIGAPWPIDWDIRRVDAAGTVDLGRQRHPDWHHGDNMKPYLRVANVFEDRLDLGDVMSMHFDTKTYDRFRLIPGDILLNEGQSPHLLGRPAMYRGVPEEMAFTNSLIRFRAKDDVLPEWALLVFCHYMHAGRFTQEVRITTNIAHLSANRFKSIEFPVPPLDIQERLIEEIREYWANVANLNEQLATVRQRTTRLRNEVLASAFAGTLVDQDPADEPAAVLLKRIAIERAAEKPAVRRRASAKTKV